MRYRIGVWLKDTHRVSFSIHESKLIEWLEFCDKMNYSVTSIEDMEG